MWRDIFVGVYFCGLAIFCILQELMFAIRTDQFPSMEINIAIFRSPGQVIDIFWFLLST